MATKLTLEQMKQFVRGHPTDVADDEQMMVGMYKVMPDLHLTIEDMIAEGDKLVCCNMWRWTDPSGKKMQFHGFVLWRFEGGKTAERWAWHSPYFAGLIPCSECRSRVGSA